MERWREALACETIRLNIFGSSHFWRKHLSYSFTLMTFSSIIQTALNSSLQKGSFLLDGVNLINACLSWEQPEVYCKTRAASSDSADLPCDQLPEVGLGSQRERLVINLEKHVVGRERSVSFSISAWWFEGHRDDSREGNWFSPPSSKPKWAEFKTLEGFSVRCSRSSGGDSILASVLNFILNLGFLFASLLEM